MELARLRQYMRDLENWERANSGPAMASPASSPKAIEARSEPGPEGCVVLAQPDERNHAKKAETIPASSRYENMWGEPTAVFV